PRVLSRRRYKPRRLGLAWDTPRGPEIDHDGTAAQLTEPNVPVAHGPSETWRPCFGVRPQDRQVEAGREWAFSRRDLADQPRSPAGDGYPPDEQSEQPGD